MKRWTVDASVAVKWFVPEREYQRAAALLEAGRAGTVELWAPELIVAEFGSALTHKVSSGEITEGEALRMVSAFLASPVTLTPSAGFALAAFEVVGAAGLTFYDALYVAAAEAGRSPLVTADEELVRRLQGTGFSQSVVSLGDLALSA